MMSLSRFVISDLSVKVLEYPEITNPEQGLKRNDIDSWILLSSGPDETWTWDLVGMVIKGEIKKIYRGCYSEDMGSAKMSHCQMFSERVSMMGLNWSREVLIEVEG